MSGTCIVKESRKYAFYCASLGTRRTYSFLRLYYNYIVTCGRVIDIDYVFILTLSGYHRFCHSITRHSRVDSLLFDARNLLFLKVQKTKMFSKKFHTIKEFANIRDGLWISNIEECLVFCRFGVINWNNGIDFASWPS